MKWLPAVADPSPQDRLPCIIHRRLRLGGPRKREERAIEVVGVVAPLLNLVPDPLLESMAGSVVNSDVQASNVPGPPVPLYLAGARMVAASPLVATIGAAVNISMVTYDGSAFVGVSSDDRACTDLDDLVEDLRSGFATVTGAAVGPADRFA